MVQLCIASAGYRVSSTHCTPLGVKTDAPASAIWDIMRCWAEQHPRKNPPEPDSYMGRLLAKPPELKADFSRARVRECSLRSHIRSGRDNMVSSRASESRRMPVMVISRRYNTVCLGWWLRLCNGGKTASHVAP